MLLTNREIDLFHAVPYPMVEETVYSYLVLGLYNPPVLPFSAGMGTRDEALEVVLRFYEVDAYAPGDFGVGCDFERQYGHKVSRKDVRDFLNAHPHGVYTTRDTFEHFLQARYGRNGSGGGKAGSRPASQPERPITYRATPSYRPASSQSASSSQTASDQQSAGRSTPAYRPAPPTDRQTAQSGQSSVGQESAPVFRPTPSYHPAPPSQTVQTGEISRQGSDRSDTASQPITPPQTPKYRPAPPSPSSRSDSDGKKPPYRPMTDSPTPNYRPASASGSSAAAVPFQPSFRVSSADSKAGSLLQSVLPTVIRAVCIASLVFLFLERRLTDQWVGTILLIAGAVFAENLAGKWSLERLAVCGILLLVCLAGQLMHWWVFSLILVLVFFYFH